MTHASIALQPSSKQETLDIGLDDGYRTSMAQDLSDILASTYRLTIKSHLYHWNVVGPLFKSLHELTEEHYRALFEATDIVAERIRALGHLAPVDMGEGARFAPAVGSIVDTNAADMIEDLIAEHESAVRTIRAAAGNADDAEDFVTTDMLTDRADFHEKALWMLKAIVAN